ncbi:TnsA endonuclease N-terminal domain-containing protein [Limnoraphis robusta Tam1]|uniref:TnsA endonuclease N-terminal domain-containing protein n=1 Tax=Limnoraphis robusta CCNP1315 TaxID=3110306 RepID=A0ABU5TRB9_9CYAN|nr:TnsA endonuclease N-terminal domain-containing protein [Limnoraphis robusta]MEA5497541.1 TnsA endonuclease N-terminal domain-containing protein [Limnoraphis robusta BA-68 BA1]MEA5517324.1 TnsA endonuclease N-terminal domain-containing protein [Limnoraphis robusta CCNP1315]MEA5542997.1 TnsA endonuclease N-terminal domain-containing protein [Limnoraphis robusta Tam1]MEA5546087.1 TnsA endonuclease N-terminal domain-containing protein [Limnoraphis robusta CCNP1324]
MAKRSRSSSSTVIEQRLKEGRGQGKGENYNPWLHTQDVASQGLAIRIKGWKTSRVHHLLSKLEGQYFYVLEWSEIVSDIREQYPLLPLTETLAIAEQLNISHPSDPYSKEPVVMTTDFLITSQRNFINPIDQARTIKYAKDLQSQRTLEKLEIERCYWQKRNIDWGIVTEREIPKTVVENIKWLHTYLDATELLPLTQRELDRIEIVLARLVIEANSSLTNITNLCDDQLGIEPGTSLSVVRHLLANRKWTTNMNKAIIPSKKVEIAVKSVSIQEQVEGIG